MLIDFLENPIFLIFTSYGLGTILTFPLMRIGRYSWFEEHNYISDRLTRKLGVLHLGWLIRKTFLGKFNQKLVYTGKAKSATLKQLIDDMTFAEVNHLLAFCLLLPINISLIWLGSSWGYILLIFALNIIFNLYLVLLQQYNKRRIRRILSKLVKRKSK